MQINFQLISNVEVEGIDMRDYPDFSDSFLVGADYNGTPMSEEMIEYINDNHSDFVYDTIMDNQLYLP